MALKTTVQHLKQQLHEISHDLEKAERGNRAAAQRVRTNTIKFAKVAKQYRKESIAEGRKDSKATKKATKKKTAKKAAKKVAKKTVKRTAVKKTAKRKGRR